MIVTEQELGRPVAISQVMVHFAARHGVDAVTCLDGTGISQDMLIDAAALVSRDQELRLVENLLLALPDVPALGFELGLQYSIATFGLWGFALRTSRTLREALATAIRYLPLSTAYCRFGASDDHARDEFVLIADPTPIPTHLRRFLLERDLGTAVQLCHELGLSGFRVRRVEFDDDGGPARASRIDVLCGVPLVQRAGRNAVVVQLADVERPLPMYDPLLVRLLEDQCRAQLERRQIGGLAGQVRHLLLGTLGLVATLEDVAQRLAMSPRSLRRRLDDEGTSFREIVEAERRQLAGHLLEGSEMKLDELAIQLGYGDTASFTRAFRRWYGCAPGEYRRSRQPGAG